MEGQLKWVSTEERRPTRSFDVDMEARYLREVSRAGKIKEMNVVIDVDAVETSKHEETAISEAGSMVATGGRWSACDLAGFILQ